MSDSTRDHQPGDPVRADDLNAMNAGIRRLGRMRGAAGLVVRESAGSRTMALDLPERMDARLTGSYSGGYPWVQTYRSHDGGSWFDSDRTGTVELDPAFERRTGDLTLSAGPTVYQFRRAPTTGQWIFAATAGGEQVCMPVCGGCVGAVPQQWKVTIIDIVNHDPCTAEICNEFNVTDLVLSLVYDATHPCHWRAGVNPEFNLIWDPVTKWKLSMTGLGACFHEGFAGDALDCCGDPTVLDPFPPIFFLRCSGGTATLTPIHYSAQCCECCNDSVLGDLLLTEAVTEREVVLVSDGTGHLWIGCYTFAHEVWDCEADTHEAGTTTVTYVLRCKDHDPNAGWTLSEYWHCCPGHPDRATEFAACDPDDMGDCHVTVDLSSGYCDPLLLQFAISGALVNGGMTVTA